MAQAAVIQHLTAVSELVGQIGDKDAVERPRHHLEIVAALDRCRSMLGAVRLLLAHGFAHEAVVLARPLFNDSLMLAEFATVDERQRAELVVGWTMQGIADVESVAFSARARGDDVSAQLALLARQRTELADYARRHGAGTRQWKPDGDAKRLAEKHGRGDDYIAMLLTHHFVHGSTMAVGQRYSVTEDDHVMVGGPHAQLDLWADGTGLFAAASMLHAARAGCVIFGWAEPPEIEQLFDRTEQLQGEIASAP